MLCPGTHSWEQCSLNFNTQPLSACMKFLLLCCLGADCSRRPSSGASFCRTDLSVTGLDLNFKLGLRFFEGTSFLQLELQVEDPLLFYPGTCGTSSPDGSKGHQIKELVSHFSFPSSPLKAEFEPHLCFLFMFVLNQKLGCNRSFHFFGLCFYLCLCGDFIFV
jgi:hypothetical protein